MSVINLEVLVNKLNPSTHVALEAALSMVSSQQQRSVEIAHWLYNLLDINDDVWQQDLLAASILPAVLKNELRQFIDAIDTVMGAAPTLSQSVIDAACEAWLIASLECDLPYVTPSLLLASMCNDLTLRQELYAAAPSMKKINYAKFKQMCIEHGRTQAKAVSQQPATSAAPTNPAASKDSALAQYTVDLTMQAKLGKLDPVVGRADEIQQAIDVLLRRKQNNPILTGEPGVGKTACVEGLAQRIADGEVPDSLKGVRLLSLDLTLMQAGASVKGEFEKRLKALIKEVQTADPAVILFIDEAHILIGAGGQQGMGDAANMLKPALARGELRTIAATTWTEYKKYFEKDPALVRRFQPVQVLEPTPEQAVNMLRHSVAKLEKHHGIHIQESAIDAAVHLSHKYLSERKLPDKAFSLLDTACAKAVSPREGVCYPIVAIDAKLQDLTLAKQSLADDTLENHKDKIKTIQKHMDRLQEERQQLEKQKLEEAEIIAQLDALNDAEQVDGKTKKQLLMWLQRVQHGHMLMPYSIDKCLIAKVLSNWTGIPVSNMMKSSQSKLTNLADEVKKRVFGQDNGIDKICKTLLTSGARLSKPTKPLGVFMLVGPSGVGKTETAHAIAEQLFGSADKMTVINMSSYKEAHKASTLTGSPPGYVGYGEGGVLTEAVRRQPHSLILLDEMEKAHPSIQDIFYQMLDRGIMRDSEGRDIDFRQTVIVMTSNAADTYVVDHAKELEAEEPKAVEHMYQALEKHYKPAFLGRLKVVPYMPLAGATMKNIIAYQLNQLKARIQEHYQIPMNFSDAVVTRMQNACQIAQTGARQIAAIIDNDIAPMIAKSLLTEQAGKKSKKLKGLQLIIDEDQYKVVVS